MFIKARPRPMKTTTEHVNRKRESQRVQEIIDKYIHEHRSILEQVGDACWIAVESVSYSYYASFYTDFLF